MIGRLLQTAASTFAQHASSRPQAPLESVTEEAHTRDLLFPDTCPPRASHQNGLPQRSNRTLATAKEAADYDDRGGLDMTYPNDVRIIIAQDADSRHHQPQVLYDSRPPAYSPNGENGQHNYGMGEPQKSSPRGDSFSNPNSPRHHASNSSVFSSLQAPPQSPTGKSPPYPGSRSRTTFTDARSRQSLFEQPTNDCETPQIRIARDAKEETNGLLGCMFGAPGFRLEPSTKIHFIPKRLPDGQLNASKTSGTPRPLSSGGFAREKTPLVRTTSVADMANGPPPSFDTVEYSAPASSRSSMMFTRLFGVNPPDVGLSEAKGKAYKPDSHFSEELPAPWGGGPRAFTENGSGKSLKPKKTPMYAIAVILQLPLDKQKSRIRSAYSQQGFPSPNSSCNEFVPSNSWPEHSSFTSFMDTQDTSFDPVMNANVSYILHHWNIISRSMELLELNARTGLSKHLEQLVYPVPLVFTPGNHFPGKTRPGKQKTQQMVSVMPGCLQNEPRVRRDVDMAAQRIISGLRSRRVVTGQGRWGAWREEARWVGRWAGNREQNFFFFNLLTAFLGSHTIWLQSLDPLWYRKKYALQQQAQLKNCDQVQQRTVIIAVDKMAARRLIFILAAFLPSSSMNAPSQAIAPSTESSPLGTALRESSVRPGNVHKVMTEGSGHTRSVSFSFRHAEGHTERESTISTGNHERQNSDTKPIKGSPLRMPYQMYEQQKSSISTDLADSAIPLPHFTTISRTDLSNSASDERPEGGNSLASIALSHSLAKLESNTPSFNDSVSRWGSLVSSFWSNSRDYSTESSYARSWPRHSPVEGKVNASDQGKGKLGKLEQMVEEADMLQEGRTGKHTGQPGNLPRFLVAKDDPKRKTSSQEMSWARSIPRPQVPERMPIKLSMNEDDGYIDISMQPNYSINSSLASSFASIRLPGAALGTSREHYSPYGSITYDSPCWRSESIIDVVGWLKFYQPDVAVQAVRPYDSLIDDIKASMRMESQSLPAASHETDSRPGPWIDISVTLVADTTHFTVERLRLRRRKKAGSGASPLSQASTPGGLLPFEEQLIVEQIMDMDATLIDAIERVLAQRGDSYCGSSRSPSPHRTSKPESIHDNTLQRSASVLEHDPLGCETPHSECKRIVLGALEEVVKSVVEQRDLEGRVRPGRLRTEPDSTLKEGIRRSLMGIEDGEARGSY